MKFYTDASIYGNNILLTEYVDGRKVRRKVPYKPYLFAPYVYVEGKGDYKSITGEKLGRIDFDSIKDGREFIKKYSEVNNFDIYGMTSFLYPFLRDEYPGELEYDPSIVSVCGLDIEVETRDGYPDIETALNKITAITISRNGMKVVFSYGDYTPKSDKIKYFKCTDEYSLLQSFINIWTGPSFDPDVVTGWNIEFFDIPYIINRIRRVLGDDAAKQLSPWGSISANYVELMGRKQQCYEITGIVQLDYLQMYKKFMFTQHESYKLDHIALVELGEQKVTYDGTLDDLYDNDFERFIDYNIHDVTLVDMLDDKLKLIYLVMAIAYDAKVMYSDTFTTVRAWDVIIHNYLLNDNIVVSPTVMGEDRSIVGGYVKDPMVGESKWVVSLDLNSLYPHLIMQYNISPECYMGKFPKAFSIEDVLDGKMEQHTPMLVKNDVALAANGCLFKRSKAGFLPQLMSRMYEDRKQYKDKMIACKKEYETIEDKKSERAVFLSKEISRYDRLQQAKKIQLNSAYGALGNKYFRWYKADFAEAITMSGQLSIRWIEKRINEFLNSKFMTVDKDYVIASDTDSVYLTLDDLVSGNIPNTKLVESSRKFVDGRSNTDIVEWLDKFCSVVLQATIDNAYKELADLLNAKEQKMFMKREAIANKAIWTAKKRYILNVYNQEGVNYAKPKLKMMGIEAIRSSTPMVIRGAIKEALGIIMDKTEADLQKYIVEFREKFNKMSFEEIAFPRGVNQLDKWYDSANIWKMSTPIHVKGALIHNHLIDKLNLGRKYQKIRSGEKVKFCYLKDPNPTRFSVIASPGPLPEEFKLEPYLDYNMQFIKAFLDPLKTILNTIGWETEKRSTLDAFF